MRHRTRNLTLVVLAAIVSCWSVADAAPSRRAKGRSQAKSRGQAKSRSQAKARRTRQTRKLVQQQGLRSAAVRKAFVAAHETHYSVKVPSTPIRDQRKSGRCWAYAWTKTLQTMALSKGGKGDPLSASFINYHALRTLAHGAIDQAKRTAARPEFNIYGVTGDAVGEGGYAHWANEIVKKHGIVPETKMTSNTFDARKSHILQNKLHRVVTAASEQLWHKGTTPAKRRKLATKFKKQIDTVLATMVGKPPQRFTINGQKYTPKTYRQKALKLSQDDLTFVTLSHDPTRAFNRRYREVYAGKGIPEGQTYNVSMNTLQTAVKKTLKRGVAAQVAVNVDWDNPHRVANQGDGAAKKNGILSLAAFGYGKLGPAHKLSKRARMEAGVSLSNHMMVITAHQPKKRGKQARWLIDNSHGKSAFRAGRFDMYNDYFKHYVEEVTVPRSALPKSLLTKIDARPALDSIGGMPAQRRKGQRWTPKRKTALVQALLREELSIDEAAKRYKVSATRIQSWQQKAERAISAALRGQ
jgi:bleomycin hydrolase